MDRRHYAYLDGTVIFNNTAVLIRHCLTFPHSFQDALVVDDIIHKLSDLTIISQSDFTAFAGKGFSFS